LAVENGFSNGTLVDELSPPLPPSLGLLLRIMIDGEVQGAFP
jgi:hypothetical protein